MIYLFNSLDFILFFISIFILYWVLPQKFRNLHLLAVSYIFYASWDWRFLGLLVLSSTVNYLFGFIISNTNQDKPRKIYLLAIVLFNLLLLGFFKYFNFFTENLMMLLNSIGLHLNFRTLSIILPIGISFYTFQNLSYPIDIYRKEMKHSENLINFLLFTAYFPQLIAGPIERAKDLLPQIKSEKNIRGVNFKEGFYLFVYGLFKKAVIADSVANIVAAAFDSSGATSASIMVALYAYAIQIYCDFSGYTDMARGMSLLLGIRLSSNFNLPYFSKSPAEFWRKWHITLSNWVRDYVYVPLGGNKSRFLGLSALLATWLLMGLWHGAAWNFVMWGIYWFCLIVLFRIFSVIFDKPALHEKNSGFFRAFKNIAMTILMLHFTVFGWLLFRASNLNQAYLFAKSMLFNFHPAEILSTSYILLYAIILFLFAYELMQYFKNDELFVCKRGFYYQMLFYILIFFIYIEIGGVTNVRFIYFQF